MTVNRYEILFSDAEYLIIADYEIFHALEGGFYIYSLGKFLVSRFLSLYNIFFRGVTGTFY